MPGMTDLGDEYTIDDDYLHSIVNVDVRAIGSTGLRYAGGIVMEERLRQLEGQRGIFKFREMVDNDPACFVVWQLILNIIRTATWSVKPASTHPGDIKAAAFLESCMHDMQDTTWLDTICEMMSMWWAGFSIHEMVLKQRLGGDPRRSHSSKYNDGRWGWQGLPIRSQDSIIAWDIRDDGSIQGFRQEAAPRYFPVNIRMDRCLHFRPTAYKNNPMGRSCLRGAFIPYTRRSSLETVEGIGIEREMAGLPCMGVPPELLRKDATPAQKAQLREFIKMLSNMRADEKASVIYPLAYNEQGKPQYELKLLTTGGARAIDPDKTIQRYDHRVAMTLLADFMLLGAGGSGATGSWAMHDDKTRLFIQSVGSYLDVICAGINDKAVPYVMSCNSFLMSGYPKIQYSGIEKVDMAALGMYLTQLSGAGMQLFPDENLERAALDIAGLPLPEREPGPGEKPPTMRQNQLGTGGVKVVGSNTAKPQGAMGSSGIRYDHEPVTNRNVPPMQ
jgi:hypothetical protein